MPQEPKRLILHIGSNKTGSSALQLGLYSARAALAEQGVCYPKAGIVSGAHHLMAAACHPGAWRMHRDLMPEDRQRYAATLAARMIAEAEEAGCRRLVVSSEYLWDILPIWLQARFVAAFPDWEIEILALIRRPEDWAVSTWLQAVKGGNTEEFGAYLRGHLSRNASPIRYDRVIRNWQEATRARRTHLLQYEEVRGGLLGAVCERIGVDLGDAAAPTSNRSPSAEEVDRLLEINRSDKTKQQKAHLRARVMMSRTEGDRRWTADPADIEHARQIARQSLDRLAKRQKIAPLYES